jgi:hypothetical protein
MKWFGASMRDAKLANHGCDQIELVVNQISNDKIVGYLSVPKAPVTGASGSSSLSGN